jgi:hypothetical protein
MKEQHFVYQGKGANHWRQKIGAHASDFQGVVRWIKTELGLSTAKAINLGRALFPEEYNEFRGSGGRIMTQRTTQTLSIPRVKFIGL